MTQTSRRSRSALGLVSAGVAAAVLTMAVMVVNHRGVEHASILDQLGELQGQPTFCSYARPWFLSGATLSHLSSCCATVNRVCVRGESGFVAVEWICKALRCIM